MSEVVRYRVQQIVDNGQVVQMTLAEDVQTEPVSQKQLIMENVSKKLDQETKEQVMADTVRGTFRWNIRTCARR